MMYDVSVHLPRGSLSLFSFDDPSHFPAALAMDLLLRPAVPGPQSSNARVVCSDCLLSACRRRDAPPPAGCPDFVIGAGDRHFLPCPTGQRVQRTCHDPAVRTLIYFLDAILGSKNVVGERGGGRGRRLYHTALLN